MLIISYIKYRIYPIKKELQLFTLVIFSSAIIEIILVNLTNSWTYTNSQILGIPLWPPIFWGLLSTTLIVGYEGLVKKS